MNEIEINKHDFDNAKNQLKEFSEKIPDAVKLQLVPTNSGLFDLFDHNVTGVELNKLTNEIQKQFIAINGTLVKSVKEFGQVYVALEALDKDYIQAIILAIKAAEEVGDQAKKIAEDAKRNTKDIAMAIEAQKNIIKILEQFKSKIDRYKHLENIEEIWIGVHKLKKSVESANDKTKVTNKYFQEITVRQDERIGFLEKRLKISFAVSGVFIGVALVGIVMSVLDII